MRTLTTSAHNEIAIGEDFEVAIQEPGATGYRFRPLFDERLLSLVSEVHFVSKPFDSDCIAKFRFRAQAAGSCELSFNLCAPWDQEPADVRRFLLCIRRAAD